MDLTTHVSFPLEFMLFNTNSLSAQVTQGNNVSWAVPLGGTAEQTSAVDFSTDQLFTITAQWPVAGTGTNSITLLAASVEHLPAS